MTTATLRTYTAKDLAQMARQKGVSGWHSMRKDELIAALAAAKAKPAPTKRPTADAGAEAPRPPKSTSQPAPIKRRPTAAQKRIAAMQQQRQRLQDLSSATPAAERDQLLLLVRDPFWLQATWEVAPASVARAKTALGQHWHGATPVLRIGRLGDDGTVVGTRQVKVHGGVGHWYIDVTDPPARYRAEIGYVDATGEFYSLARSNEVQTPEAAAEEPTEHAWSDVARNADRVFAMSGGYSEGRPQPRAPPSPGGSPPTAARAPVRDAAAQPAERRVSDSSLEVEIDAELVLRGSTSTHTHLTIQGEPIEVRQDGTFAIKLPFPDRRQVIPVVASSADGLASEDDHFGRRAEYEGLGASPPRRGRELTRCRAGRYWPAIR